ncbi:g1491 [Coccomyxa viridis]|uniref:G1491 protein n=1 Tax=Coccomyxa viridis TaxID=1274662 RepID=A0ABP1FLY0_9CHLO
MKYLVIGGGIAGVCCTEELCRLSKESDSITLITAGSVLKGVSNVVRITHNIESFEVTEKDLSSLQDPRLKVLIGIAKSVDVTAKSVHLQDGSCCSYDKLCICTGAVPKAIADSPHVLVLRDRDTVDSLAQSLQHARRVAVVGNGGIAMELVFNLRGTEVVWIARRRHIGDAFFDADAAQFLREQLQASREKQDGGSDAQNGVTEAATETLSLPAIGIAPQTRASEKCMEDNIRQQSAVRFGHAVGPRWASSLSTGAAQGLLRLELNCEVQSVEETSVSAAGAADGQFPVRVHLSSGASHGCDLVVSATGVLPDTSWLPACLERSSEGSLLVDRNLQTSVADVWAAGDICAVRPEEQEPCWFQMRLWTQARTMGIHAAHCMTNKAADTGTSFAFELFTHATHFMGQKVILLGLYNGQGLDKEPESDMITYSRALEGEEPTFVRVLLLRGKMVGAVLIGETDLEEAFENLILDGLDLSSYGPALLDPNVEIDHMFD